jgi:DNA-binding transcriptional LysR family regulator
MNQPLLQRAEKIKVSDFTILGELARLGSIREVARLMRSTPAQISRRLKTIEKTVGYRIFERGPKGLILTGSGQEILRFAQMVNGEFQNVISHRKQKRSALDRPLGVASTSFLLSYLAVPALGEVLKKLPDLRSYVLAFNPDDLSSAGIKSAFQLAIHPTPIDWPRSWQTELMGHIRWGLFAKKGHSLTRSQALLDEVPFVYPMMWDGGKLVVQNDNCPLPVNQRNSFVGTQTAEQAMHLIQRSNVVGFLPHLLMQETLQRGQVVEIKIREWPSIEQSVYLSFRTDLVTEAQHQAFRQSIRHILLHSNS